MTLFLKLTVVTERAKESLMTVAFNTKIIHNSTNYFFFWIISNHTFPHSANKLQEDYERQARFKYFGEVPPLGQLQGRPLNEIHLFYFFQNKWLPKRWYLNVTHWCIISVNQLDPGERVYIQTYMKETLPMWILQRHLLRWLIGSYLHGLSYFAFVLEQVK